MPVAEPWQKAEIAGPTKALVITRPEVVVAMVKRAKRPILVVGHYAAKEGSDEVEWIDHLMRIAKAAKVPLVATAHTVREFTKRGFQPTAMMPAVDIVNRLQDPTWKGLDGMGQYDLVLFTGLPYYMGWVLLSSLKHFAKNLKTICLDRFYQPQASWSFPNVPIKDWLGNLETIISKLEEGGK